MPTVRVGLSCAHATDMQAASDPKICGLLATAPADIPSTSSFSVSKIYGLRKSKDGRARARRRGSGDAGGRRGGPASNRDPLMRTLHSTDDDQSNSRGQCDKAMRRQKRSSETRYSYA
eukprot:scaffold206306_cov40-Prasinocladus_malaysianus.AAC.2